MVFGCGEVPRTGEDGADRQIAAVEVDLGKHADLAAGGSCAACGGGEGQGASSSAVDPSQRRNTALHF